jgi:hypothetical protein
LTYAYLNNKVFTSTVTFIITYNGKTSLFDYTDNNRLSIINNITMILTLSNKFNFSGGSESTTVAATTTVGVVGPVDNGESVILKPVFSFQCSAEGLYPHSSDCAKFWLCEEDGKELEPQLYICPEDYLVSFRSQVKFSL